MTTVERNYQLTSCPVLVTDPVEGHGDVIEPCGADMAAEVHVHSEGAEYGVFVVDMPSRPACGHSVSDIAKAEQRNILGIEP